MINWLKYHLRKVKALVVIFAILNNYKTRLFNIAGYYKSKEGATHLVFSIEESVTYIFNVFNDYLHYGGIREADLKQKVILEIGPGDNLGVALLFLVKGAKKVICMDRFYAVRNIQHQLKIYTSIKDKLQGNEKKRFDECFINYDKIEFDKDKLCSIYGKGIENADFKEASFDLIVSRAVLEHVYDIDKAFAIMKNIVKPGGYLFHKIDLRDHGIFSSSGLNPLTFLTLSPMSWRMMSEYSGRPNRRRIDYYRRIFNQNEFDAIIHITHIVGLPDELIPHRRYSEYAVNDNDDTLNLIREIRPRLSPEFRILSDEDLAISGIFLVARRNK